MVDLFPSRPSIPCRGLFKHGSLSLLRRKKNFPESFLSILFEIPISELSLKTNEQVSEKIISKLEKLILRRVNREPISRILGRREFWGRSFFINENVLDPRGDTETLIEFVIEKPVKSVLELGTGSGAIAITLACEWKEVHVTAIDISE